MLDDGESHGRVTVTSPCNPGIAPTLRRTPQNRPGLGLAVGRHPDLECSDARLVRVRIVAALNPPAPREPGPLPQWLEQLGGPHSHEVCVRARHEELETLFLEPFDCLRSEARPTQEFAVSLPSRHD